MSQTNTNTNNSSGNIIWSQICERGGRGQGGPGAEVVVIAVMVAETTQSLNIYSKRSDFQINNYQKQTLSHSIQEDY